MRSRHLFLLLLILLPCVSFSQTIPAKPKPGEAAICLSVPAAAKVRDSLKALPLARREARSWRRAAGRYRLAADTAQAAYLRQVAATESTQFAYREQLILTTREMMVADKWRTKAHKRGFWNWVLATALAGVTYGFVTH